MRKPLLLAACVFAGQIAHAQTDLLVQRGDNFRTGANLAETTLTLANVNSTSFGKVFTLPVDGYVYGQPLYKSSLTIPGQGTHNVVFVATEHDSVYAFDADSGAPLWQHSFINPAAGITTQPSADTGTTDITPEVGITSTPVIDATSGTLYVVAKTKESGSAVFRIHALAIASGAEKLPAVVIQASVAKPGGGTLPFNANWQQQRPGLVLANGVVYVAFGSSGDNFIWQGWLLGYNASTLAQVGVFCSEPDGSAGGGIWASGEAPPLDASGNLYLTTGNGSFDAARLFGDAYVKLSTSANLAVVDYFAPFNQAAMNPADLDVASAGATLLPDSAGTAAHPHLMVGAGKDGTIYLLDRDNMGHFNGSYSNPDSQIIEEIPNAIGILPITTTAVPLPYVENNYSNAAFWANHLYWCGINDVCKMFNLSNGLLTTSASSSASSYPFGGAEPVITASSPSAATAIMWAVERDTTNNITTLHAYDATTLGTELYNSNQAAGNRDQGGAPVKFVVPTVLNGKAFVGAQGEVDVYGLLASNPPALPMPTFSPAPGSYPGAQSVSISDSNTAAQIYYTLDGSNPTTSATLYNGPIALGSTTTFNAIAVLSGFRVSPIASATYTIGAAPTIAFVQSGYATPQAPQTAVSVGFAALQLSGDLNVVVVGWNDSTRTVSSVTDTAGNAYSLAAGPTVQSGTATQAIYYARNISGAAAGANTVTVSFNGAAAYPDIRILEYSGLDATNPLDVTAAAMGSGTSSSSGAATTSSANDLIIGANLVQSITTGPGAGFTNRVITAPDGDIAEDRVVTTTGSYTASAATTSGQWIMQMAAFRRAGGTQTAAPTAPGNLAVTAVSSAQINLSWSASTETGGTIAQYLIERCQGAGCTSFAQIGTSAGTAFNDTGLAASTTYTYRVRAQDALNTIGPYSGTAAATTLAPVVPTAPSGLTATAAGSTQINLTWGVSTETGGTIAQYLIERCQGAGCTSFAQIGTSAGTAFNDAGLTGSTSYSYRVRAKDAVNNTGPYSSVASVSTAAPVLTAPAGLAVTAASNAQINLSWSAATETGGTISQYLIERCKGAGCGSFAQVGTAAGTAYNDGGLAAATTYSYRVRATDAAGNLGPYSATASATTSAAPPAPIAFVQSSYATPQTPQSSVGVTFTASQSAGDLNVVVVGWNDSTQAVTSVSDSAGNVYALAVGPTVQSGAATQAIYYATSIVGAPAGGNTVTVTFSAGAVYPDIRILEYSGIITTSPLDVTASAVGNSASSSSGAATTTVANELIIGANLVQTGTTGAGAGFTTRMITTPDADIVEDRIVSATGAYTATAPLSSGQWLMQMATFKGH